MTTMFNTMPTSALPRRPGRPSIIAALSLVLALALSGCGMVLKLGYGQASPLAFRWLDRYADFDDAQSLRVRGALDDALAWHRRSQLPDYVQLLARAEAEIAADATPERMCAWAGEIRTRVDTVVQYLAPAIADVAVTLTPAQLARIEKRYAETNAEYRDEHLQKSRERRHRAAVKREIERAESLYGSIDDVQRELVDRAVAASPHDAEASYAERQRRQHDALALLRRLREVGPGGGDGVGQVRAYLLRYDQSPRESQRAYVEKLTAYNCAFASTLHNATSAEQRRVAAKNLRGYQTDLRALIGEAPG